MPANILRFDSENSQYAGFEIHQDHDDLQEVHDHQKQENGPTGDGWLSTVVLVKTGEKRGPFKFTGDAQQAMRKWAEELNVAPVPVHEVTPEVTPLPPSE